MTMTWCWCHLAWDSFPNAGHSRESGNPTRKPFDIPADELDSRFRGNDRDLQCLCLANDLGDRDIHVLTPEKLVYIITSRGFARRLTCRFTSTSVRSVDSASRKSGSSPMLHSPSVRNVEAS